MAHIAKYKAPSCGHMLAHYTRSKDAVLERDNIDETRTHLNYVIGYKTVDGVVKVGEVRGQASWDTIKGRMETVSEATGRRIRKDAVVMADMVITAPKNVNESDLRRFFNLSYIYLAHQVGRENMLGGYVHMDETTPHMHIPFTPIKDGKFNYKGLCPRAFYQGFHKGLGDFLEERMGYRPEIELTEERKEEKVLSSVPQAQLDQARAAVLEPIERERDALASDYERKASELEAMKREIAALQEHRAALESENSEMLIQSIEQRDRLESLRQAADGVAANVEVLESVASDIREFEDAGRSGKGAILNRIADRCDGYREQLHRAMEKIRVQVESIRERMRVPVPQPRRQESLRESVEHARQAAQALNRSAPSRGYSPGRGR